MYIFKTMQLAYGETRRPGEVLSRYSVQPEFSSLAAASAFCTFFEYLRFL